MSATAQGDASSSMAAERPPRNVEGTLFVVLCCVMVALAMTFGRNLGPQIAGKDALPPVMIVWVRFLIGASVLLPIVLWNRISFRRMPGILYAGRIGGLVTGMILLFAATGLMPVGDATAISFVNPLFTMVFAILFLGERVGIWRWSAAFLGLFGALVIMQPGTDAFQPAALLALLAAAVIGAEITFIKGLSRSEPPLRLLAVSNFGAFALISLPVPFFWQMPTLDQWGLLVGIGFLMLCAQMFFLVGVRLAEVTVIGPVFYTTLVFAAIFGWLFFNEIPALESYIGAAMILIAAAVLTWRENRAQRLAMRQEPQNEPRP